MRLSADELLFKHIVDSPDGALDLATAALVVGEVEYPNLDVARSMEALDALASRIRERAGPQATARQTFDALRDVLFEDERYCGDDEDYYDPKNSLLSDVLERRLGIPLSLTVLVLCVSQRLSLPLEALGASGNFFVRFRDDAGDIVIDPDDRGSTVSDDELAEILGRDRDEGRTTGHQPISARQLVRRMLTHLALIYGRRDDHARHLAVVERLLILDRGTNHMLIGLRDHLRRKVAEVN